MSADKAAAYPDASKVARTSACFLRRGAEPARRLRTGTDISILCSAETVFVAREDSTVWIKEYRSDTLILIAALLMGWSIDTLRVSSGSERYDRREAMPHRLKKTEGIKIMVTPAELEAIDSFAEQGGHWSRSEAVRRLIQKGYAAFLAENAERSPLPPRLRS